MLAKWLRFNLESACFLLQVLENFSDAPMTPKQILHVIQTKGLKEMRSEHTHTHTGQRTSALTLFLSLLMTFCCTSDTLRR